MLNDGRDSAIDQTDLQDRPGQRARASEAHDASGEAPASKRQAHPCHPELDEALLESIAHAVLSPDRAQGARELDALLASGVARCTIIDAFIPAVARHFGEAWLDSGHSFAEVTIAVSRLQAWLRELDREIVDDPFRFDAPELLVVVPEGCHHTLGAMVAMSRFRRLGALVRLSLGKDAREIGALVRGHHVDMVALSAAGHEDLEFLANIINCIRSGVGSPPPIVLGGPILDQIPDAAALIGADHATTDPEEALSLCGLTISESAGPSGPAASMRTSAANTGANTGRHPHRVTGGA